MIHIVLDTSIYREKPRLDSKEFSLLQGIASSKKITLHVPYVVEREFTTFLEKEQREKLQRVITAISRALEFDPHGPISKQLKIQLDQLETKLPALVEERSEAFIQWLKQANSVRHSLTIDQAKNALEAYFLGTPPFKEPKVRKNIPDSFIFQAVLEIYRKYGTELAVIVQDDQLASALRDAGIHCSSSLREFLSSPSVQPLVAEQVISSNRNVVYQHVLTLAEKAKDNITKTLEMALLAIDQSNQHSNQFPGETGDIYLSGIYTPHEIHIEDIEYLGGTIFLAKIVAKVELTYEFPIYKNEAFELSTEKFYLSELNDHYFEAETTDEFQLTARLELEFPPLEATHMGVDELKACLLDPEISVSDINDLEIIHPEQEP